MFVSSNVQNVSKNCRHVFHDLECVLSKNVLGPEGSTVSGNTLRINNN